MKPAKKENLEFDAARARQQVLEVERSELNLGEIDFYIIGRTPFLMNSMSMKAVHELLLPSAPKARGARAEGLKHDPLVEFRGAAHKWDDRHDRPTRLRFPTSGFKKALATAALRVSGTSKTEMLQLILIPTDAAFVDVYGIPEMHMSVVRSSGMNRTPDIRTRAIIPEWCAKVRFQYMQPNVSAKVIFKLMSTAGVICGAGDDRAEKGGSMGRWEIVEADDKRWEAIAKAGSRAEQDAALLAPQQYDVETAELYEWFVEERASRREEDAEGKRTRRSNGKTSGVSTNG